MKVFGLTGGIATGKSTVAQILREEHGVPVLDADQAARRIVEPGRPALARIVAAFGDEVLQSDGSLDRGLLRQRITHDAEARATLNAITHPAIRAEMATDLALLAERGVPFAVVEAALLVETGSHRLYAGLIVVTCSPEVQLDRLLSRDGTSLEDARALVAAQMPMAEKEAVADAVIRNDSDVASLKRAVATAWSRLTSSDQ